MEFKDAFKLIYNIHDQCGDRDAWNNARERLKDDILLYTNYGEWVKRRHTRTDISQDELWDLECLDASIEMLFVLVKGKF